MTAQDEQLNALTEIRDLMNRSSRFLSLSGISGVFAGIFALIGAGAASLYYGYFVRGFELILRSGEESSVFRGGSAQSFYIFFFTDAGLVLGLSLLTGWFFSKRKAKKAGLPFWDATAWRALANLMIPLAAGGIFCLILLFHGLVGLIAPATLLFYGLALLNASKYTVDDIRYLGIMEIILGLAGAIFIGYGLVIWAIGFGVLHIIYGAVLYFKYDRK
jgi:hypothetical protein